jgi:hypothetical protein
MVDAKEVKKDTKPGALSKLTEWKKEPSLLDLKNDFTSAKPIHDAQVSEINKWLDNLNITGSAKPKSLPGNSNIAPKLIRKQAEWRYAALSEPFLSTDDIYNVLPVTWEDKKAAVQNEMVLNHQINNKIDKVKFIDEYVRTAVDEGTVIVQVGWAFEEEEVEEEKAIVEFRVNDELLEIHQQLEQLKAESPSQYATDIPEELKEAHDIYLETGQPIEPVIIGMEMVKVMKVIKNHPTLEVCDYRNVVIDPTAMGDIDKASFVIKSFESSKSELAKSGKNYKNLDAISIENNSILGTPDHAVSTGTQTFNFNDDARKKFVVYEYWGMVDIEGNGKVTSIVASWVGDTLIRMEESPFPDKKLPFVLEQYLPKRKNNYGEPDGSLLEDNQKVIGAVMRGMIDIMGKSANGQTGVRKDMLDSTNRRKFDKGLDYEFNANTDPRQGIFMHTYPEIPASAQFMVQLQNQEAEAITGVQSFSQGISGAAMGDVAAGVRGALDAASKRELGILRRLSSGMVKIGRKIISMNAEFLNDDEVIRITNEEFVEIRKDDLKGEFDLKLSISTAEEDANKAEQLAFMLQTAGPSMDPMLSKMLLADIAKLRKMPEMAKRIMDYEPQPDPIAQEKAVLENELLKAKIAELNSQAQENTANAQLDIAKVNTEAVKAEYMKSDTDLKNLEFVEQESGVEQERALQLQREATKAQAELKVLDADLGDTSADRKALNDYLRKQLP